MKLEEFYPLKFDGSSKSFNSLIRTLLIRANYDAILKKVTSYKGMHQYNDSQECWTLKFDGKEGIYGLIQSKITLKKIVFKHVLIYIISLHRMKKIYTTLHLLKNI